MSARGKSQDNHRPLLEVRDLHVAAGEVEILKGLDLTINLGEVHAIMGPNGSGKSTLANVLAGRPEYQVTEGRVLYHGENLLAMAPDKRALAGIFLAFQYPVELPGVREREFLRTALEAVREQRGLEKLSVREFNKLFQEKIAEVEMSPDLVKRSVNEGRMPVGAMTPMTLPSSAREVCWNRNRSCRVTIWPSMPVHSVIAVTRRTPSEKRWS